MQFTPIDFLIGFFLMNAMPHMLFGLLKIRFLSLFGFSSKGNIAYAVLNVVAAMALYHYEYGLNALRNDGIILGLLTLWLIYLLTTRFLHKVFQEKT